VLLKAGWVRVKGTKHLAFKHPDRRGKVNLDEKWKNVKPVPFVSSHE
jgi:predicted RNA binding protein YcfA (HicA-like mRNA interferase family)